MRDLTRLLFVSASILSLSSPAFAQSGPPASADTSTSGAGPAELGASDINNGEIVVTATKRATTVQNTPISITALTDKSLQNLGATQLSQFVAQVPGLNLVQSDSGRQRISIRGIQTAGESTVGLYYGETPLTGPSGTSSDPSGTTPNLNLFDVQRVEVLRGPQGTLYGSGSMGGTLRVIFKDPNLTKFEGASELQAEGTQHGGFGYFVKGMVNAPLVDGVLAGRLVLYRQQDAGYTDDPVIGKTDLNRNVLQGGRAMLEFKPSTNLQINATAILQTQRYGGTSQWTPSAGDYVSLQKIASPAYDKLQVYNLDSKLDIGFGTLTMANSYYRWNIQQTNDNSDNYASVAKSNAYCGLYQNTFSGSLLQKTSPGNTSAAARCTTAVGGVSSAQQLADYASYAASLQPIGAYQPRFVRNFTNELRLSSNSRGPLIYTFGIFREDRRDRVDTLVFPGIAGTGEMRQPVTDLGSRFVRDLVTQTAEFGEVSYKLFNSRLELTAGARHYHYDKTVGGANLGYNYFNGQTPSPYSEIKAKADGFVKKFNADFHVTKDIMVYATASQGFRPGGANLTPGVPAANVTYSPDTLWNYEGGVKTQFFDRKVTFNVDGYRIDWSNLQTSVRSTAGNFSFLANVGGARVYGAEVEASVTPLKGLLFNATFNYNHAYLTADQILNVTDAGAGIPPSASGRKGDLLPNVPKMTASAGAEYDWPLFGEFDGLVRLDYTYTGRMQSTLHLTDAAYRVYGSYSLFNARVGIQKGNVGVFLYCSNLFDKIGINVISAVTGVPDYYSTTRPRTVGMNVRTSF
ncbi:TonB-dependent receptor [Sphingomonas nostoxanthinifaciens]|uniref:TonB-dependent receptor n=1 Tax=Sphingomonas nostoxanthinifaciens TaxID=2872652 RepID=UPI001CC1EE04|nr:TonB-dependent receptor [Sphingomonas nostoxanthinifaciens]UAK25046.1 TonB-dependent receptor [Sphingomonas nostoxanthinifaciens]